MFGPFVGVGLRAYNRAQALIDYLFKDDFTTDEAAPITSPRTAEPGPGTWDIIADTGNNFSISDGKLVWGGSVSTADPVIASSSSFASSRDAGLLFSFLFSSDNGIMLTGLDSSQSDASPDRDSVAFSDGALTLRHAGTLYVFGDSRFALGTEFHYAIVLCTTGAFHFIKGGAFTDWTLLFPFNVDTLGNLYFIHAAYTTTAGYFDKFHHAQLPAPFDTDDGIATDSIASPSATDTFTHEANCVWEFEATTLPSSGYITLFFRIQDTTNYWQLRVYDDGNFRLYEVVAGSATNRGLAGAGTLSGGERIVIICDDETITGFYDNTQAWSYAGAVNFKTETDGQVYSLATGGVISKLTTWQRTLSGTAKAILDKYTA